MRTDNRRVAVIGGNRIPFARANGTYAHASDQDMLTTTLDGLIERFGLEGERLGEVVAGAVLKHARDRDLTRESVLGSKLAPETPAYDLQQACGTGLEAVIAVANKIALGQIDVGIAGGVDTASDAPIAVNEDLRHILLDLNRAKSLPSRARTLTRLRPGQLKPELPRNAEPRTGLSMGEHAAIMATDWGVSRAEQDELAAASHQHLAAAYERGFMDDLVSPYLGLERDANLRADSTVEKLAKLKPVFGGEDGTMTAGNSTPLTDGASAVLLARRGVGAREGLADPGLLHRCADRRRRPRAQARGPADGAGLRDAAAARPQRRATAGLRPLRDPRGVRGPGAGHAEGVGGPGVHRRSGSAATGRSARWTAPSSTSTAGRWPPGTRSPPPAGGSWPRWPRRCTRTAPAGG